MPSHSFHYERRSVGSRGYAESPAAWRDPVAFENGTRLDTSTVVFASYARNKVQRWCAICAIIRWILISACQFLLERSSDAGSGSIVGPVLMENRSAYGVACSSSVWKRAQWPVRHPPARIPGWTLSVGKHVVKHVTPVYRLQLLIRDKTLVRSLLNIQRCTYGANTSQTSTPLALEFLRDIRGMQFVRIGSRSKKAATGVQTKQKKPPWRTYKRHRDHRAALRSMFESTFCVPSKPVRLVQGCATKWRISIIACRRKRFFRSAIFRSSVKRPRGEKQQPRRLPWGTFNIRVIADVARSLRFRYN